MLLAASEKSKLIAVHRRAIVLALEDDRTWFAEHPERHLRLRRLVLYEFNRPLGPLGDGFTWRVLVERDRTGTEVRIPVWVPVLLPETGAEDCHLMEWLKLISTRTYDNAVHISEELRHLV
jgi:hypothetical protein